MHDAGETERKRPDRTAIIKKEEWLVLKAY